MRELRDSREDSLRKLERVSDDIDFTAKIRKVLQDHGISVYRWSSWEDELRQALSGSVDPKVIKVLNRLTTAADELKSIYEIETREEQS